MQYLARRPYIELGLPTIFQSCDACKSEQSYKRIDPTDIAVWGQYNLLTKIISLVASFAAKFSFQLLMLLLLLVSDLAKKLLHLHT